MTKALIQVGVRGREQPGTARWHPGDGPLDLREDAIVELGVQDHEEFRAVAEMVKEGALGYTGLGDDLVDAHAAQSSAFRQRQAGGDQLLAGGGRALLPDAGVHCVPPGVVKDPRERGRSPSLRRDHSRSTLRNPCAGVHHSTMSSVASSLRWVSTTSAMSARKRSPSGPSATGPAAKARPETLASPGHCASAP